MFRPGNLNAPVQSWLPALDGVIGLLTKGATVADIGCGHGISAIIVAQAFPGSTLPGYDFHLGSIAAATAHARAQGVRNVWFEVSRAQNFPGRYAFVTCFDGLHDMSDQVAAATHIRKAPKQGGRWMLVEPNAGDQLEDNLNPVGRLYYPASTMICVPTSLAQETRTRAWRTGR